VLDLSGLDLASPPQNPEWVGHHLGIGYSTDHVNVSGDYAYTVGTSGLTIVVSANAVQAAPVGLATTISTAAGTLAGTTITFTSTATATKAIAMTTLQNTIIGGTLAVVLGGKLFPKFWLVPYNLACYTAQLGRIKEAETWFKRAMALNEKEVKRIAIDDPDLEPLWKGMEGSSWKRA